MYYLIIDVETTCCNQNSFPRDEMEIIEIGAVLCNPTFQVEAEFQSFVRPIVHPTLTEFCLNLTSIQQRDVDSADLFDAVVAKLKQFLSEYPSQSILFCSWGGFDKKMFHLDCQRHRISYPFSDQHCNLKARFRQATGLPRQIGMAEALRQSELTLEGTHHRGLDDARNIARLLPICLG